MSYLGYILEERDGQLYSLSFQDGTFFLRMKRAYCVDMLPLVRKEIGEQLVEGIPRTVEGEAGDVYCYAVKLPMIFFPNYAHKKLDHKQIRACAKMLETLFYVVNILEKSYRYDERSCLSLSSQLMTISTVCREDADFHAAPLSVGFDKKARDMLLWKYREDEAWLQTCAQVMLETYLHLTCNTKRKYENRLKTNTAYYLGHMGIVARIRKGGVPSFSVPGNCACLGTNPEHFLFEGTCDSHNLDNPLQQMIMLAGLVTFWNEILIPLEQEYDRVHVVNR